MNATHLHIVVNHLPVAFALIALLAVLVGFIAKSAAIKKFALGLVVLLALTSGAAYFTGKSADVYDSTSLEAYVERHEQSAQIAWFVGIGAGVIGLAGLLLTKRLQEVPTAMMLAVLVVLLVDLFFLIKTANLGGQIVHSGIRTDSFSKAINPQPE